MLEHSQAIEWMIHLTGLGMVIGIAAVVAFTIHRNLHVFRTDDHAATGVAADHRAH